MKRSLLMTIMIIVMLVSICTGANAAEKTFIYARSEALQSFDPWNNSNVINYIINQLLYDYLIYYENGEYVPGLAESWEVADDNLSITFKLHEGIKFHNGEDCTAEDVAIHWNRITQDSSLVRYSTLSSLKNCEVLDDYTVRFNLNNPDGYFMMLLAQFPAATPGDLYKEIGDKIYEFNYGTGPWKFVSYSPGNEIVFERNNDYWGTCTSNVDRIIYRTVTEDTTRVSAIITGDITMADGIPADQVETLEKAGMKVDRMSAFDQMYVGFNNRGIFANHDARMAVNYGIDREAIVELIVGAGSVATWPSVKGAVGFDETSEGYPYDFELAQEYLKKSGYNGEEIRMIGPIGDYDKIDEVLETIYNYLSMVGFNCKLEQLQSSAFSQARKSGDYDMYFTGNGWVMGDGYVFINQRIKGDSFASGFVIPELNEAIEAANQAMDAADRDAKMKEVYRILWEGSAPMTFLYTMECIVGYNPSVSGVVFSGSKHTNLRNVCIN
ncbi:MAG: ABC transporter substrate-binding protein [Clostridia bacterium]|nr:ABC transporter substrate-binding protein [Clostridia bacterium]